MKMIITPVYSDLFDGDAPTIESLLNDIPSEVVISILCLMNAKLYSEKHTSNTQIELFKFLTFRQSNELRSEILNKALKRVDRENDDPLEFFAPIFCLEFIHLELLNYRDFSINDTTPLQELNFLKAYFLVVEKMNSEYFKSYEINNKLEGDFFRKNTWPTLINQIEANLNISYVPAMIKALALFNFLEYHSSYSQYVTDFLKFQNKKTSWNYVLDLLNLLTSSWDNYMKGDSQFFTMSFKEIKGYETFFEHLTLNIEEYKVNYKTSKKNFTGIKERPFYLSKSKNARIVINWNFITNKLYEGFLFDFYKYSGISTNKRFENFLSFKEYISSEFIEKFMFKRLVTKYLEGNNSILLFDEEDNFPDCYSRNNKKVFIIEIKDAYFPASSIDSLSYTKIKEAIDKKYNLKNKGTGQLIKYIQRLISNPYQADAFTKRGIKNRNILIYPIIIYTDKFFSMPGINNYLNDEFNRQVKENDLLKHFKSIMPLTFIDFNFLIEFVDKAGEIKIDEVINSYNTELRKRNKRFLRTVNMEDFFSMNDNFESVFFERYQHYSKKRENYIESVFKVLNLTEGLPKE